MYSVASGRGGSMRASGRFVRTIVVVLAAAGVGFAAPRALAAGPATHTATGDLSAVSCPTANLCYAVGETTYHQYGVLDIIKDGKQSASATLRGTGGLVNISCPTQGFCGVVGLSRSSTGSIVGTFRNGRVRWVTVGWYPSLVACPVAGKCVIAGTRFYSGGSTIEAAGFDDGVVGRPRRRNLPQHYAPAGENLSCVSISSCEMVGTASDSSSTTSSTTLHTFDAGIGSGAKIGTVHIVSAGRNNGGRVLQGGVACGRPNLCYLTGATQYGSVGVLFSVRIGGGELKARGKSTAFLPRFLSCHTLTACTATGFTPRAVPAVDSYRDGRPGAPRTFSRLESNGYVFVAVARSSRSKWVAVASNPNRNTSELISG
jgi:hypothetical protein